MEKQQILEQLNDIFSSVLERETIDLNFDTTANEVDNWDSLNHVQLVYEIEQHFGIKFKSQEIRRWNNVGDMVNSILVNIKPDI